MEVTNYRRIFVSNPVEVSELIIQYPEAILDLSLHPGKKCYLIPEKVKIPINETKTGYFGLLFNN